MKPTRQTTAGVGTGLVARLALALAAWAMGPASVPAGNLQITRQPVSQAVRLGSNAVFSVLVSSDQPITYQWLRNGTRLPGAAQATLVISSAQYADTGFYTAEVSDGAQRLTSDAASLLVTATDPLDTWRTRFTAQAPASLYDVIYADGQFVAVGAAGTILTSSNGFDWVGRSSGTTNWLNRVNFGGGLLVAVGNAGTILTSPDGAVWTARRAPVTSALSDVVYGDGRWVVAGANVFLWSSDGLGWAHWTYAPTGGTVVAVAHGNGLFVATGSAGLAYLSTDGQTWNLGATGRNAILDMIWDGQRFVGAGADGVLTSLDGTNWLASYTHLCCFRCVANGPGRLLVAAGPAFLSTSDGTNWMEHQVQIGFSGFAYGSGTFVAVNGNLLQSGALVPELPKLHTPPTNWVVRVGSGFTNNIVASGSPLLSYQWLRNGTAMSEATNTSLMVTNCSSADSGDYAVVVANPMGAVTSLVASVQVGEPPTILSGPISQSVVRGGSVTLSCVATGTGPLEFRWVRNGLTAESEQTEQGVSFFTLTNVQATNTIRVAVTNLWSPAAFSRFAKIMPLDDTDGDGLPDEWEERHGLRPDDPSDAAADTDGDGASNLAEYRAGTDSQDARSVLKLQIDFTPALTLSFEAVSNHTYTVQWTGALDGQPWSKLADLVAAPTNRVEVLTDESQAGWVRFYRLITPRQFP